MTTDQHLITRFTEHRDRPEVPVTMHLADCNSMVKDDGIVFLASTNNSEPVLEALFVRELKSVMNT